MKKLLIALMMAVLPSAACATASGIEYQLHRGADGHYDKLDVSFTNQLGSAACFKFYLARGTNVRFDPDFYEMTIAPGQSLHVASIWPVDPRQLWGQDILVGAHYGSDCFQIH